MRINNNIMAMNANRQLGINNNGMAKALEKLSSGFRINRAGDDAAGLSISEKMRAQIRGLHQASMNAQDGISLIQTAEGALDETHAILQRIRELVVKAGNEGTLQPDDLQAIQDEINALIEEIGGTSKVTAQETITKGSGTTATIGVDTSNYTGTSGTTLTLSAAVDGSGNTTYKIDGSAAEVSSGKITDTTTGLVITVPTSGVNDGDGWTIEITTTATGSKGISDRTQFNGKELLDGNLNVQFQIGANQEQQVTLTIGDMSANGLGIDSINVTQFGTPGMDFDTQLGLIDTAIGKVSTERSKLGAMQNRLEHTIRNLDNAAENLQAAESRIRDVDMAKEMMEFTKQTILQQASTAMLAQANQMPTTVLQLLR